MSMYMREKLRDFILAQWPPHDPTEHAFIISTIQTALRNNLITKSELEHTLQYVSGYVVTGYDEEIARVCMVLGELTGYTDRAFVRTYCSDASEIQQQVYVQILQHIPLERDAS